MKTKSVTATTKHKKRSKSLRRDRMKLKQPKVCTPTSSVSFESTPALSPSQDQLVQQNAVIELTVEAWRLRRTLKRTADKMTPLDQKRFNRPVTWFYKKLEETMEQFNLRVVDLEGQVFEQGMAVTPLNIDDLPNDPNQKLVIEAMLEPIIMNDEGVVKAGSVMLAVAP